jgi:hypothetical protein
MLALSLPLLSMVYEPLPTFEKEKLPTPSAVVLFICRPELSISITCALPSGRRTLQVVLVQAFTVPLMVNVAAAGIFNETPIV